MGAKLSKKGNYNALEAERKFKTYIKHTDRKDNFLYNANVSVFKSHSYHQSCDDLKSVTLRPFDRNKQRKSIPKTVSCIELSNIRNVRGNIADNPDVIVTENKPPVIDTTEIDSTIAVQTNNLPNNAELSTNTTELNKITSTEDDTYPQTPEDTLYALIQKLKTLKKRIKHYDGTDNIATIQFQLDIYYNELEAIQSEKTMVNELRNKVLEKIRHFKQVLTEKDLKPLKSPNKDVKTSQKQYLEETFNKFQNLTTTLDVLKEDIIDYYGTSDDAQFGTIMLKLDDCRKVLADIDPRGDVRIIISKEEYEDYIIRLVKQFEKIVSDNEQDFEVCRMTLSTIDRRKDRRKRSRNIEINYPTNQEQQELILLDLETPGRNNYDLNDYSSGGSRKDSDEVPVSEVDDDQSSFQSNIFQIDDLGESVDSGKRVKMSRMMSQESEDEFYDCYEVIPLESPGFNRSFSYGEGLGCIKEVPMLEDSVTVNGFADIFGRNVRKISNIDDLHVTIDNKVSYDLQNFPSESAAGEVIDNDGNYFSNHAASCGANGGIILTPEVYLENLKELTFDKHISNENNLVEIEQQGYLKELVFNANHSNQEQKYLNNLGNDGDDSNEKKLRNLDNLEHQRHLEEPPYDKFNQFKEQEYLKTLGNDGDDSNKEIFQKLDNLEQQGHLRTSPYNKDVKFNKFDEQEYLKTVGNNRNDSKEEKPRNLDHLDQQTDLKQPSYDGNVKFNKFEEQDYLKAIENDEDISKNEKLRNSDELVQQEHLIEHDANAKKELLLKLNKIEPQGHLKQPTNEDKLAEDIRLNKLEHQEDSKGCLNKLEQHVHLKEFKCDDNESRLNKLKQEENLKELKYDENHFENRLNKLEHQEEIKCYTKLLENSLSQLQPSDENNLPRVISIHEPNGLFVDLCDESNEQGIGGNQNMETEQRLSQIKRLEHNEEDCTVVNVDKYSTMNSKCTDDFNTLEELSLDKKINSDTNLREEVLRNYQIDPKIEKNQASKHSNIRKDILSNKSKDENCGLNENELNTHQGSDCFKEGPLLKNNSSVSDSKGQPTDTLQEKKHKSWLETDVIANFIKSVKPDEPTTKNIQTNSFSKCIVTKDRNDTVNQNIDKINDVWLQENQKHDTDGYVNNIKKPKRVIKKISKTDLIEPDHSDHEYHSEAEDTIAELKPIPAPRRYYRCSRRKVNPIKFNIPIITCDDDDDRSLSSSPDEEKDMISGKSTENVNKFDTNLTSTINKQDKVIRSWDVDEIDGSETFNEVIKPEKRSRDIEIIYQEQQEILLDLETSGRNNTAESSNVLSNSVNKKYKGSGYFNVDEVISNKLITKDSTINIDHNTNKSVDKLVLQNNFTASKKVEEKEQPETSNVSENNFEIFKTTENTGDNGFNSKSTLQNFTEKSGEIECIIQLTPSTRCGSESSNTYKNVTTECASLDNINNQGEKLQEVDLKVPVNNNDDLNDYLSNRKDSEDIAVSEIDKSNTNKERNILSIKNKSDNSHKHQETANKLLGLTTANYIQENINEQQETHQKNSKNELEITNSNENVGNKKQASLKNNLELRNQQKISKNELEVTNSNENIGNKKQASLKNNLDLKTHQKTSNNELEVTNIDGNKQQSSLKNVLELNTADYTPKNLTKHFTKQQAPSKNSRHVELELNIVNDCVEDMQLCVNEFDGDKTDENYSNIYKNLFDSMSILNKIKSADTVIIKRKQAILSQIMLCMRELEMKVS